MSLVYIGLGVAGLLMAITASEIIPTLRSYLRKPAFGRRTGPRVVTKIQMREENRNEP